MRDGPLPDGKTKRPQPQPVRPAAAPKPDRPFPTARGVLSQEEIEALLRPNLPETLPEPEAPKNIRPRLPADFDAVAEEPSENIEARERAQRLAPKLARALGEGGGIKASLELGGAIAMPRKALPDLMNGKACAIACIGSGKSDIQALICFPPLLVDALIASACGSGGSTGRHGTDWNLTAIDCALLEQLLRPFGPALGAGLTLEAIETDVPYVVSLLGASDVTVSEFSIKAQEVTSEIAVITMPEHKDAGDKTTPREIAPPVTAVVTARIASLSVPLSRLTSLKAGSTLLLGLPGDQPVELLSGGRDGPVAFEGKMGRKGNKMAVKVTKRRHGVLD